MGCAVGRLDQDTSGLLLMTNDNDFADRITDPDHKVPKTYLVKTSSLLTDERLERLREGVELADGPTRPAGVKRLRDCGKFDVSRDHDYRRAATGRSGG